MKKPKFMSLSNRIRIEVQAYYASINLEKAKNPSKGGAEATKI